MLCKFNLIIDDTIYELSNSDIGNWQDISYSINRADYGATARVFTSKFDFINQAYDLLFAEYSKNYLSAFAIIEVYTITNIHTYELRFSCPLDFSSLKKEGKVISMNAIDGSISALIKAKKGTQYEYVVDEIKENYPLYYDRLDMLNTANWVVVGNSVEDSSDITLSFDGVGYRVIPLYITSSEIYTNDSFELSDVNSGDVSVSTGFLKAKKNVIFDLSINLDFLAYVDASDDTRIILFKNGVRINDLKWANDGIDHTNINVGVTLSLNAKDVLSLGIYSKKDNYTVLFTEKSVSVKWKERNDNVVNIDVIRPLTVLNCLLKNINEGHDRISGSIDENIDNRLDNCLILAAESIRGIPNAKLYSSYNKFTEWMESEFGFVPVVDEENRSVTFTHRNKLFSNMVSRKIENIGRNTSYTIDSSLIHSRVRVGYDKQDYDSINGRDEFHFTNEYTTGINLSDSSYDIISPFRADPYGIEFLTQSRGKDTTDNNSDNDVFFVCAKLDSDKKKYLLVRSGYTMDGVISPDTMFNAMYSPRFMIEANKGFIGAFAKSLTFASSEGNGDVIINGVNENGNIETETALFTVGVLDVTTDDESLPRDLNELLQVEYDGNIYCGYAKEVKCKYGQYDGTEYKLIVKSIE